MLAMEAAATVKECLTIAKDTAAAIADEDAEFCARLGRHGKELIKDIFERKKVVY